MTGARLLSEQVNVISDDAQKFPEMEIAFAAVRFTLRGPLNTPARPIV